MHIDFDHLTTQKVIDYFFVSALVGAVGWSAKFLQQIAKSTSELNTKLAVMFEKITWHEKEINQLDSRVTKIEEGKI